MPKPLFHVICTTCEARLGIHDKNLTGQIVACPKCESMVLVEMPAEKNAAVQAASAVTESGNKIGNENREHEIPGEREWENGSFFRKAEAEAERKPIPAASSASHSAVSSPIFSPAVREKAIFDGETASDSPVLRFSLPEEGDGLSISPPAFPFTISPASFGETAEISPDSPTFPDFSASASPAFPSSADNPLTGTGNSTGELDSFPENRPEMSPAELFIRMMGVGIGVFIVLLLLGTLFTKMFSGGGKTETAGGTSTEIRMETGGNSEDFDDSEEEPASGTRGKTRTEKSPAAAGRGNAYSRQEEVLEEDAGMFSEDEPDEAEDEPDEMSPDEEFPNSGVSSGGNPSAETDFPEISETKEDFFESDLLSGSRRTKKPETPVFGENTPPKKAENGKMAVSRSDPEEPEGFEESGAEEPKNKTEDETAKRGSPAFNERPKSANYALSFTDEIIGRMQTVFPGGNPAGNDTPKNRVNEDDSHRPISPEDETFGETKNAPPAEYLPREMAQKLTLPLLKVEMSDAPLSSVIKTAAQAGGFTFTADWTTLRNLGVQANSPVRLRVEDMTLREVLDEALDKYHLGYILHGKNLRIVGKDLAVIARDAAAGKEIMERIAISVDDLVSSGKNTSSAKTGIQELITLIKLFVVPASWSENGGLGKLVAVSGTKLELQMQYPAVAREAEVFCQKLRLARKMPLRAGVLTETDEEDLTVIPLHARTQKLRKKVVSCELGDSGTLREAILCVGKEAGAKFIFDEKAIHAVPVTDVLPDANIPGYDGKLMAARTLLEIPVTFHFIEMPFENAMNELLRRCTMLYYYPVSADTFLLTTREKAAKTQILEFIPVGDIMENAEKAGSFLSGIRKEINPTSWRGNGGVGEIRYDAPSKTFITLQNPQTLSNIQTFLEVYRKREKVSQGKL